jgi:mRNA-degrading endonuclease YafQ of YafQ-DinJ toxin-antitoxin module
MTKLRDVLSLLIAAEPLPPRLKDHPLTGDWSGYRNCHIEPDWLLQDRRQRSYSGPYRHPYGPRHHRRGSHMP